MLDILKEAGAKPLFVIIPVNGAYYDYTGFPSKRTARLLQSYKTAD